MSASAVVRIGLVARESLRELANELHKSQRAILEEAIEAYRRECFFNELDAAYQALRSKPEAWRAELAERAEWDVTLADGLGD